MDEALQQETERLTRSWMQHDQSMLGGYLVAGVEDPRINLQSILTRHSLIVALFGERFAQWMEQEIRFALVLNWFQALFPQIGGPEDLLAIGHALRTGADNAEGFAIPHCVAATWAALPMTLEGIPLPNYLETLLHQDLATGADPIVPEALLATFQCLWRELLATQEPRGLTVLEPACGSANDYRFIEAFGLARLIDYTGFDLCEKNVRNAQAFFPQARFAVGNVFAIGAADQAMDYCIVHDLFEHLSAAGIEQALNEICRVTRLGMALGLFNASEAADHRIQAVDEYHWNTLSVPKLTASLEQHGFAVEVVHLGTWLKWRFGCGETHNQNAYTLLASRRQANHQPF